MNRGLRRAWPAMVLLVGVACSQAPSPSAAYIGELSVGEAVVWFEERTLECLGPAGPLPDPRHWRCTHEFNDGTYLEARVTGDANGVIELVGIAGGMNAEDSASFLGTTVAGLAVAAEVRDKLDLWAFERAEPGGTFTSDSVVIELQPHSPHRAVVVIATVTDP